MFRRRLPVALSLGAALVAITACSTTGTPMAAGSSGSGGGGTPSTASMPVPDKLLSTLKSSAATATAVHIKGTITDSGSQEALDLQLNKDGSADGTIDQDGTNIPLKVVDKVYYIQFTPALMSASGIEPGSAPGKLLADKWVSSKSKLFDSSDLDSIKSATDYNTFVPQLFDQFGDEGAPKDTGPDNVDGYPVHGYSFSDDSGTTADVTSDAPHYLVRVADKTEGTIDFTGWNKPVTVIAPSADEIYSGPGA